MLTTSISGFRGSNSYTPIGSLQVDDVRTRLSNLVCEKMQAICADNKSRLEGCKRDVKLLERGVFYPQEYFHALRETNQHERIDELRNSDAFFHGYVSPEYFELDSCKESPTGKLLGHLSLKKGALPSDALKSLSEGLSLLECKSICDAVRYIAILEILGPDKFNVLFASDSPTPLKIGSISRDNPIHLLTELLDERTNPEKGDLVYFENNEFYIKKHTKGMAKGFNSFCVGGGWSSPKFIAFGLPEAGLNRDEIIDVLVQEFNLPLDNLEYLTEKTREAFYKARHTKPEERTDFQIDRDAITRYPYLFGRAISMLSAERITALANATLEEARKLLDQYQSG